MGIFCVVINYISFKFACLTFLFFMITVHFILFSMGLNRGYAELRYPQGLARRPPFDNAS